MKTVPFPNQDEIEERAASWIAIIDRGINSDEQKALEAWLEASPLHGEALVKCASMWDLLDVLQPIAKLMPIDDTETPILANTSKAANEASWFSLLKVASVAVLIVGVGVFVSLSMTPQPATISTIVTSESESLGDQTAQTYKTAVGEISTVALADGSIVKLNTDSEMLVQFTNSQRNIELLQGEVYFDVAKDATKPFVVSVGDDQVTAIGTAFSVDASELLNDQRSVAEVVVTEGRVRVNSRKGKQSLYLVPGQKAVAGDDDLLVSANADSETLLAWREGFVVFEGESLTQVIREIDRYTPLKFRILDKDLASISVGGFFKTGDLDQLLLVLENNFGVASKQVGNEILLSKAN